MQTADAEDSLEAASLPESMRMLLEEGGVPLESIRALMQEFGGLDLDLPLRPERLGSDHPLVRTLGQQGAEALVLFAGGTALSVPKGARAALARRNARIRSDYDAGMTARELAKKYGLCMRHIRGILNRADG